MINKLTRQYLIPRLFIDIAFFWIALCLVGIYAAQLPLADWRVWAGVLVNYILLACAFIVNDIEDRQDDAGLEYYPNTAKENLYLILGIDMKNKPKKPEKTKRFLNVFSHELLTPSAGYVILAGLGFAALGLSYVIGGWSVFLVAVSNFVVGLLYSHKSIRLKSVGFFDVLSHGYLLGGVQVAFFLAYPSAVTSIFGWVIFVGGVLISMSGDFMNEYRDFDEDQEVEIKNTAHYIGAKASYNLHLVTKVLAFACFIVGIGGLLLNLG